jgi:hypothetical protein
VTVDVTAEERLTLVKVKIERAREHIHSLDKVVRAFFDTLPYRVNTKRDPSRRLVYYLSDVQPTPTSFATITGDAIQNLRSSLDHLVQQLYLVAARGVATSRQVSFPIGLDAHAFKSQLGQLKVEGVRADALAVLESVEPYKGGKGHDFWVLQELNNIDKHRLLMPVGSAYQSLNIGAHMQPMIEQLTKKLDAGAGSLPKINLYAEPTDKLFPLKAGDELFIDAVDARVNNEMDFHFNIVLNEPGVVEAAPLIATLTKFSDLVGTTVLRFQPCLA